MIHSRFTLLALTACLIRSALGQDQPADAPAPEKLPPPSAEFKLFAQHVIPSNFSDAAGDAGVTRAGAGVDITFPVTQRSRLSLGLLGERSWYHFDGATGFGTGFDAPWDDVLSTSATISFRNQIDDRWSYFTGLGVESSMEDGAEFQDSVTYGGFLGGMYAFSERLRIGLGVRAQSRLEDSALIVPIPMFFWQISDEWRLASESRLSGFAAVLSWRATDEVTLRAEAGIEGRAFRLDDDGPAPNGVGRDWRMPIGLGANWTPREQVTISATVGVIAWQQYTLDNENGDEVAELDTDPTFYAGFNVGFTF